MLIHEKVNAVAHAVAALGRVGSVEEKADVRGVFTVVCHEAVPGCEAEYCALLERMKVAQDLRDIEYDNKLRGLVSDDFDIAQAELEALLGRLDVVRRVKWQETFDNVVTTVGKNYLLDNGLAGSSFTAAFYLGLISSVSYTAVAGADTMASHAGWLEAGATNAPTYGSTRKTAAWSAASGGSKAFSAGLVFTFTGSGTVKGAFLTTVNTVDGTTGTLYSAGLFSGGDQTVASTNTLTASYTASV